MSTLEKIKSLCAVIPGLDLRIAKNMVETGVDEQATRAIRAHVIDARAKAYQQGVHDALDGLRLSKREHFAVLIRAGFAANEGPVIIQEESDRAYAAVQAADALLEALS